MYHGHSGDCPKLPPDRRAAPKMGDSPAAPEDVRIMVEDLRVFAECWPDQDEPLDEIRKAADMLESLLTRNRALEGENAALAARCGELERALRGLIAFMEEQAKMELHRCNRHAIVMDARIGAARHALASQAETT